MCASFAPARQRRANTPASENGVSSRVVRRMINYIATDLIQTTQSNLAARGPNQRTCACTTQPLAALSPTGNEEHVELMMFLRGTCIATTRCCA